MNVVHVESEKCVLRKTLYNPVVVNMNGRLRLVAVNLRRYRVTLLACCCGFGIGGFKAWSNRSVEVVSNSANAAYWFVSFCVCFSTAFSLNVCSGERRLQNRFRSSVLQVAANKLPHSKSAISRARTNGEEQATHPMPRNMTSFR